MSIAEAAIIPSLNMDALMDRASVWSFDFDPAQPLQTIRLEGNGLELVRISPDSAEIIAKAARSTTRMATLDSTGAKIFGSAGNIVPCYQRFSGGRMRFSNVASNLLERGERVRVNAFAVTQNLLGTPYPQNNIFSDLVLLEASGEYRVEQDRFIYVTSKLARGGRASRSDAMELIHAQWRRFAESGAPLCVFLSGGYDSRLNLALTLHYARQFGNPVHAFHEFKNEHEAAIARRVAESAKVPLTVRTRQHFVPKDRPVETNSRFIKLHSGPYRENLLRWHHYFSQVELLHPGGILIGFGAEAHKGKFYSQVHNFSRDCESVFGVDTSLIHQVAAALSIPIRDPKNQQRFFETLVERARVFEDPAARIDFVHYQTYIANGYGKRCHSVWQLFGFPMPFLDDDFLRIVFGLPRVEKEGFRLVATEIEKLHPELSRIPFTSANEKSLEAARRTFLHKVSRTVRAAIRPVYDRIASPNPRRQRNLATPELNLIQQIQPRSEVTAAMYEAVRSRLRSAPRAHIDYAIQLLFYFNVLEDELDAKFDWA